VASTCCRIHAKIMRRHTILVKRRNP
jgi:hypothetical protein